MESKKIGRLNGTAISVGDIYIPIDGTDISTILITGVVNLGSAEAHVLYDPKVVSVKSVGGGDFDGLFYYDDKNGDLSLTAYTMDRLDGDVTLCDVEFEPAPGASVNDACDLTLSGTLLLTAEPRPSEIPHDLFNGTAIIVLYPTSIIMTDVDILLGGSSISKILINRVENLGSVDAHVLYDPKVVSVKSVSGGDFDGLFPIDDGNGDLTIIAYTMGSFDGDVTLCDIEFEPAAGSTINDTCDLILSGTLLLTAEPVPSEIPHNLFNGLAKIIGELELCIYLADIWPVDISSVLEIIDSYITQIPPGGYTFIPTIGEVFGVIDYYLGLNGDAATGCDFFP